MRQRIQKEVLITSSVATPKAPKKRRSGKPTISQVIQPGMKKTARSKKALKKLLNNQIAYKPFTRLKETAGMEGNYWKLIYNTPKY